MKTYFLSYSKYHIRKAILVFSLVLIFTVTLLSVYPFFSAVTFRQKEKLYDRCGKHHAVYWNISSEIADKIDNHYSVEKTGVFINNGSFNINNTTYSVTVGSFSETAVDLGRISCVEGRMPEDDSEIALEEYYKYLFDSELCIGDTICLKKDNIETNFVICGFLDDYSIYWTIEDDLYSRGFHDYPGAIIGKELSDMMGGTRNYLVYFNNIDENTLFMSPYLNLMDELNINSDDVTSNDASYINSFYIIVASVQNYIKIFTLVFCLISVILFYFVVKAYISDFEKKQYIFEAIGASNRQYIIEKIKIMLFPMAIGLLAGILLYICLFSIVFNDESSLFMASGLKRVIYLLFVISLSIALYFLMLLKKMLFNKKGKYVKPFRLNYRIELSIRSFRNKLKTVICIFIVACLSLSLIMVIRFDYMYRPHFLNEDYYYLDANSYSGYSYYLAGDFELQSEHYLYDIDHISMLKNNLKNHDVDVDLDYGYCVNGKLLLPDENSGYWDTFPSVSEVYSSWNFGEDSNISAEKIYAIPENTRATEFFSIKIIKDKDVDNFYCVYPEAKGCLQPGKCIAFFPELAANWLDEYIYIAGDESGQINPDTVDYYKQDYYSCGDTIRIGGVKYEGSFKNIKNDLDSISYYSNEMQISAIIDTSYQYLDDSSAVPTFVISEETALSMECTKNISSIQLKVPVSVSKEEYDVVRKIFNKVVCQGFDSTITDSLFFNTFYREFYGTIEKCLLLVGVFALLSVITSIMSLVSMSLSNNKKTYGVLRSIGFAKKDFKRMLLVEYMAYWITGFIGSIPVFMYIVNKYILNSLGMYLNRADNMTAIQIFALAYIIGLLLIYAVASAFARRIYRLAVSECIRIGE